MNFGSCSFGCTPGPETFTRLNDTFKGKGNHMSRVTDDIILASFQESYDPEVLRGCTHILNVAEELNVSCRVDREYAKHGVPDDCSDTDITRILGPCIQFIADAHAAGGTVLVHCLEGVSRSVCVVLAYLCVARGMAFHDAYARVRDVRPHIDVFPQYESDTRRWVASKCNGE